MAGACGECTACCRVFAVPKVKTLHEWCKHCTIGVGCNIYQDRPVECTDFECIWLQSQLKDKVKFGPELRPDKCKVVISTTTHPRIISFITMHGYSTVWRQGKLYDLALTLIKNGFQIAIGPPGSTRRTMLSMHPHTGAVIEREVRMTEPDSNGMQWNIDNATGPYMQP